MKLRIETFGLLLAVSACSGGKVAIGSDALDVDGGGASGRAGSAGSAGSGGAGGSGGGASLCELPLETGPCNAAFMRWGFDPSTGSCREFTYGGCEGNANNFVNAAECTAQCGGDPCAPQQAEEVGTCEPFRGVKWNGTACVLVSGCSCNGPDCDNLFPTVEACVTRYAHCAGGAGGAGGGGGSGGNGSSVCSQPIVSGPCFADGRRWAFNQDLGRCVPFTYGGCQGNDNNFATQAECSARCGGPCAAQDATQVGQCELHIGTKYDGNDCVTIDCSCVGADCDALMSPEGCRDVQTSCAKFDACADQVRRLTDTIHHSKTCTTTQDCQTWSVGCGITEDGCTGAVYVNQQADRADLASKLDALQACMGETCFATCDRVTAPPACVAGRCVRAGR